MGAHLAGCFAGSAAIGLAIVACTSNAPHPPASGDCVDSDAHCVPAAVGGGGGGSGGGGPSVDDAAGGACAVDPGASRCDQCAAASCCPELGACPADSACASLMSCVYNCVTTACVTGCRQTFSAGVSAYDTLVSCASSKCPICGESGVGDPCSAPCVAGLTCNGQWCTRPCARTSDCAGIGAGLGNSTGEPNACMPTSRGTECAPGCAVDAQCGAFAATYCHSTTSADGLAVQVCASVADSGP